jgi:hypothetical protein
MPLSSWMQGEAGLDELGAVLRECAGSAGRVVSVHKLRKAVYRITLATADQRWRVVAKRLTPPVAHRNQLMLERWLPDAGLEQIAPKLMGVAAARAGRVVWHLYEDVGDATLKGSSAPRPEVEAAIHMIATLHARFAGDPVLAECRLWGMDHGIPFYDQSIGGAIAAVGAAIAACSPRSPYLRPVTALLERLKRLAEERDQRTGALAEFGGTETLLHGDLWLQNIAVMSGPPVRASDRGPQGVRLIDWDSVGPGSFAYDISTLIMRFPPEQQSRIFAVYRAVASNLGIAIPDEEDLYGVFTTAEYARLACDAIWPALTVAREGSRLDELAAFNDWFRSVPAAMSGISPNGRRSKPHLGKSLISWADGD